MAVGYRFGNLIVRKDVYYPLIRRRYLYVSCSICSEDVELFPNLFKTNKQQIEAGHLPCGCGKGTKWSSEQYKIRIQRECTGSGLSIYKVPDNISSKSKITLKDTSNLLWEVEVKNFLKGVRPKWFKKAVKTKLDKLIKRYSKGRIKVSVDKDNTIYEYCCKCGKDESSKWGLRTIFKTNSNNLKKGVRMCRCSPKHHRLLYEWKILLNRRIQNLGGVFLGIEDFDNLKTDAWVYYVCRNGGVTKSRLYNLWWGGKWCRCCTLSNITHYLYVTLWKLENKVVWGKYGITSKPPKQRFRQQQRASPLGLQYKTYKVWELPDYRTAKSLEDSIKALKIPSIPSRSEFPDGYTETFLPTEENMEKINSVMQHIKV